MLAPYWETFEILRVTSKQDDLNSVTVPTYSIRFEYSRIRDIFRVSGIRNEHVKEHVKSINAYNIDHAMDVTPSEFTIFGVA